MKRFAELYFQLDQTTRTNEKVQAMRDYFLAAPARDAIWAVYLLSGRKLGRALSSKLLRTWAAEVTGHPEWLVEECYHLVGDLSETLSLIMADTSSDHSPPLHVVVEEKLRKLHLMDLHAQRDSIIAFWKTFTQRERFVLHKLLSGNFRVGVSRLLLIRALAEAAGVEPATMAHRLSGNWSPDAATMARLLRTADASPDGAPDPSLPYPFMLAHALHAPADTLGDLHAWQLEWKWDGIRAQLIRRQGQTILWSRGEELITDAFPEIVRAADLLPEGTVLDGEILGWNPETHRPLTFAQLQPRINRKKVEVGFWPDIPVRFMAFDLLEDDGRDVRALPLADRHRMLALCLRAPGTGEEIVASPAVECPRWQDLARLIDQSRAAGVEGVMIKRLDSPYRPGRPAGLWWKLKVQPYTLDAVLVAAQPGHGRRAGLLTDYTFAVWDGDALVTITKAYSGLTDAELAEVDRDVRAHARQRFGPVYTTEPRLVFEIGFEAIQRSTRHKSGIALRFPRILRMRQDKKAEQADTIETVRQLLDDAESSS